MIPFKIWFNQIAFILFTLFNLLYLSYGNEGKSTIQMAKLFSIYVYTLFLWKKFAVNKSILKHSSFSEKFTHKKINESRDLNVFLIYMYIYIHINVIYLYNLYIHVFLLRYSYFFKYQDFYKSVGRTQFISSKTLYE